MNIIYFGYNSFLKHKRGVENVIDFQANTFLFTKVYYIHWGSKNAAYKANKFISISIKNCWYWPVILNLVLIRMYKKNNFFIHSHNPIFSFFSFFKTHLLTVHDGLYYLSKQRSLQLSILFYFIEYLLYYRCGFVHFISEFSKSKTCFGNRSNFKIIPNTSHLESKVGKSYKPKKSENIEILIVRSIEERANFHLLLNLAIKLKNLNYFFNVAGTGPLLTSFQSKVQQLNLSNVKFFGYVDDESLLNLYSKCQIVMMIAEYGEGFGLPIIEGYLFNKPVIASNKCAIPEIIISKEFLFENNVDSISNALIMHSNLVKSNFREYYDSKYSNQLIYSIYNELYTKLSFK